MSDTFKLPQQETPKKGRGCLYGCLAAFIGAAVLMVLVIYGLSSWVSGVVDVYTDAQPMALQSPALTQEETDALNERVASFIALARQNAGGGSIELNSDEINTLLRNSPGMEAYAEMTYFTIEGNALRGKVSFPLEEFVPFFAGRYLNGDATFSLDVAQGRLLLYVESLTIKDAAMPEEAMREIRNKNLFEDMNVNPEFQAFLDRVEDIAIEDGKVRLTLKEGG